MKKWTLFSVLFSILTLLLICPPVTLAADLSLSSKEQAVESTGLNAAQRTAQRVDNAHNEIIKAYDIDLNHWIRFDLSDIPKMTEGEFPGVEKELALKFARAYYFDGTMKEHHKIGDFKPLLLLNKEKKEVLVGLLHSDKSMTMVKFNEADSDKSKFVVDSVTTK